MPQLRVHFVKTLGYWFTLFAILGLLIRKGIMKPYTLQPFEFFIILAGIATAFYIFLRKEKEAAKNIDPLWYWLLGGVAFFVFLGFINSIFLFGFYDFIKVPLIKDFFLLGTCFLGFLLSAYYGQDKNFRKKTFLFLSGAVIFMPLLLSSDLATNLKMADSGLQFSGLQNNPTVFGMFALVALSVCAERTFAMHKWREKIIFWALSVGITSLILWSASRSVWIASAIVIIFICLYYTFFINQAKYRLKNLLVGFLVIFFSFILSFAILPPIAKIMALDRIAPQLSGYTGRPAILRQISLSQALSITEQNNAISLDRIPYQNRQTIWPQAIALLEKHPYGIGPEYFRITNEISDGAKGPTIAHNTILQAGLTGGLFLILVYLIFWGKIWQTHLQTKKDAEWIWISASMLGISFVFLFGDFLFYIPTIWILFGLVVAREKAERSEK